jgi:phosphatidylglycerophosphate synthase
MAPPVDFWVLELLESDAADPGRRVGGLSLALRLALDAQAAGAAAIAAGEDARRTRACLVDRRLELPVTGAPAPGARVVVAPAHLIVHRATLRELTSDPAFGAGSVIELSRFRARKSVPYFFEPVLVVDGASARDAEQKLFRSLRKTEDGWTSRFLNRYLSLALSRLLVRTPLAPNQLSLLILGVGLAGAGLAARGDYFGGVAGAALFQLQSVLDGCDGEMSRVTHRTSRTGQWLDTVGDDVTNYAFFGAAGVGLYRATESEAYLWVALFGLVSGLASTAFTYRYLIQIGSGDLLAYPLSVPSAQPGRLAFIKPLFKRDTFVFITFLMAIGGALGPMLCLFGAGAFGVLLGVLKTEFRLARERRGEVGERA